MDVDGVPSGMSVVIEVDGEAHLVGVWVRPERAAREPSRRCSTRRRRGRRARATRRRTLFVVDTNVRAEKAYTRYGFARAPGRTQAVPGRPDETEVHMAYRLTSLGRRAP